MGNVRKVYKVTLGKPKGKRSQEYPDIDGKILKRISA
jgi:hypothetical protein